MADAMATEYKGCVEDACGFTSWADFYESYRTGTLAHEGVLLQESPYGKAKMLLGSTADEQIVTALLETPGLDKQDGIDGLVQAVLTEDRYAYEAAYEIMRLFKIFCKHGLTPNLAPVLAVNEGLEGLLDKPISEMGETWYEEENNYTGRGTILAAYSKAKGGSAMDVPEIKSLNDVDTEEAKHVEDLPLTGTFREARLQAISLEFYRALGHLPTSGGRRTRHRKRASRRKTKRRSRRSNRSRR